MSNWSTQSFRPPSDDSSYFGHVREDAAEKIRNEINQQVRNEANTVIHNIVTQKDAEITKLVEQIDELKAANKELESQPVEVETPPDYTKRVVSATFSESEDIQIINNALYRAIRYGQLTEDDLKDENLEKLRTVILSWKEFFEEYKWKSNYISTKIKKLLKDTEKML
eukprot:COSAG06_NODE_14522_length_1149_cov_14.741987_2_plen_168_part_00